MSTEYFSSLSGSTNTASSTVNNNNACTSTRWLTEEVFALIDLVQRNEAIYNPRHKYYFCRPYVENFWREVDLKLEKNPGASLAKWTNLRISFRREYTNYLEEKVPPCWTYFDRMFFLHPYLRKHQQSKSLDSQVQDALVQISSLSNRLQRERAVAAAASAALHPPSNAASPTQPQIDNYLEYFDDPEPNASELDDMIDDDPRNPQDYAHSTLTNDIKSECEDNNDEYDHIERAHGLDEDEAEAEDAEMRNYVLNSLEKRQQLHQQQQQRLQHLQRLQTRAFYEDFRHKRARSHDNISSSQSNGSSVMASSSNHTTNVSFVRPTFTKPIEVVSTTTQNHNNGSSNGTNSNNSNGSISTLNALSNDNEPVTNSSTRQHTTSSHYSSTLSHTHAHHQHQRFDITALNSSGTNSNSLNPLATQSSTSASTSLTAAPAPSTPELCDCKTDPDAMFLMSLLPDIQKLNGRDRGKIKIAFQNILQDYLYPD